MAIHEINMPALGMAQTTGVIVEWVKKLGDVVKQDETIMLLETDKSVMDIPSPISGILVEVLGDVGVPIEVGLVVARIDTDVTNAKIVKSEKINNSKKDEQLVDNKAQKKIITEKNSIASKVKSNDFSLKAKTKQVKNIVVDDKEKILASPLAKVRAQKLAIDISELKRNKDLYQPYNSDDVNTYMSITHNTSLKQVDCLKADISLERFFSMLEWKHEELSELNLFARICVVVLRDNKNVQEFLNGEEVGLKITSYVQSEYKELYLNNINNLAYIGNSISFIENASNVKILIEYIESEHIIQYQHELDYSICISLCAKKNGKSTIIISVVGDLFEKECFFQYMEDFIKLLENPLLLIM